jgi:hypothetical protein
VGGSVGDMDSGAVAGKEPRRAASAGGSRSLKDARRLGDKFDGSKVSMGDVDGD